MKINVLNEYGVAITRDMTEEEEAQYLLNSQPTKEMLINELKANLQATDYQAIKFAEGLITLEEYEPIKAQRQEWREQINNLDGKTI